MTSMFRLYLNGTVRCMVYTAQQHYDYHSRAKCYWFRITQEKKMKNSTSCAWFQSICFIYVSNIGHGRGHIIHKAHKAKHMHSIEFLRFCFHFLKLQRFLFSFFWQFFSHQNQKFFFHCFMIVRLWTSKYTQTDTFKK